MGIVRGVADHLVYRTMVKSGTGRKAADAVGKAIKKVAPLYALGLSRDIATIRVSSDAKEVASARANIVANSLHRERAQIAVLQADLLRGDSERANLSRFFPESVDAKTLFAAIRAVKTSPVGLLGSNFSPSNKTEVLAMVIDRSKKVDDPLAHYLILLNVYSTIRNLIDYSPASIIRPIIQNLKVALTDFRSSFPDYTEPTDCPSITSMLDGIKYYLRA